jgi:RNA polymerase-binding transcription factor DksA
MEKKKIETFRKQLEQRQQELRKIVARTEQDGREADVGTAGMTSTASGWRMCLGHATASPAKRNSSKDNWKRPAADFLQAA